MKIERHIEEPFLSDIEKRFSREYPKESKSAMELSAKLSEEFAFLSRMEEKMKRYCEATGFKYRVSFSTEDDYCLHILMDISFDYISEETEEEKRKRELMELIRKVEKEQQEQKEIDIEYEEYLRLKEKYEGKES